MSSIDKAQFDTLLNSIIKNMDATTRAHWAKRAVSPFLNKAVKAAGSVAELEATWQPELPQGRRKLTEPEKLAKKFGTLTDAEKAEVRRLVNG
ncbi:MAG: hypothetical protein ACR2RF_25315 [Geminicoccaceae bacterium]